MPMNEVLILLEW